MNDISIGRKWHQRLMHPGQKAMQRLAQLELTPRAATAPEFCDACAQGKMHRVTRQGPRPRSPAHRPLDTIHLDVVGPLQRTLPPLCARYALLLTDDCCDACMDTHIIGRLVYIRVGVYSFEF
jgi:hypothetical protein